MRIKNEWRSASMENYKEFCKVYPDTNISFKDWKIIIYSYNEEIIKHILETGEKVKLPEGLGEIAIIKKKRALRTGRNGEFINLHVNWKKSRELKKRIYEFNFHTEGFSFHWRWFKRTARIHLATLFYFNATRVNSRLLGHYLKTDNKYQHIYMEWDMNQ